jgi:hypothetical protein
MIKGREMEDENILYARVCLMAGLETVRLARCSRCSWFASESFLTLPASPVAVKLKRSHEASARSLLNRLDVRIEFVHEVGRNTIHGPSVEETAPIIYKC